ncbi:SAG-related sequence SRS42 [Besnoitia besnoiti]|uniref:SAG-related sequence SRS42 n=1 Tax=Besnoitia besnoiti TaxID=94643 RepID=A0A2A9MHT6_BESBE|nr:SAG-related sequence SRS42 [Besnoitia besnoiti]PFH35821.1 SAG-related sequence SRS42 [Besnoitia besnoiti]
MVLMFLLSALAMTVAARQSVGDAAHTDLQRYYQNARKELQYPFGKYNIVWFSTIRGTGTENVAHVYPGWTVAVECNDAQSWSPSDFSAKKQVCEGTKAECSTATSLAALFPGVPASHQWWTGGDGKVSPAVLNVPSTVPVSKTFTFQCKKTENGKARDQSYTITLLTEEAPPGANFRTLVSA